MNNQWYKFRVSIASKSGFYAQYSGDVEVFARSSSEAQEKAFEKLRKGAFPDRSRDMWKVNGIEVLEVCEDV
jgi:hypothetical protein